MTFPHPDTHQLESSIDLLYEELIHGIKKTKVQQQFSKRPENAGVANPRKHASPQQSAAAPLSKRQKQKNLLKAYAAASTDLTPFETQNYEYAPIRVENHFRASPETSFHNARHSFHRDADFGPPTSKTEYASNNRRPQSAKPSLRKSSLLMESESNLCMDLKTPMEHARKTTEPPSIDEALKAALQQRRPKSAISSRGRATSLQSIMLSPRSQRSSSQNAFLSSSMTTSSLHTTPRKSFGRSTSRSASVVNDNPMYSSFGSNRVLQEVYQAAQRLKRDPNAPDYLRVSMNIPVRSSKKIHVVEKKTKPKKGKRKHRPEEDILRSYSALSKSKSIHIGGRFGKEDRDKHMFWKQWKSAAPAPNTYDIDRAQRALRTSGHIFFGTEPKCQVSGAIIEASKLPGPQYYPHYSHVFPDPKAAVIKDPIPVVTVKRERQIDYMRESFGPRNRSRSDSSQQKKAFGMRKANQRESGDSLGEAMYFSEGFSARSTSSAGSGMTPNQRSRMASLLSAE